MESHVKEVGLIKDVALDIRSLMDYSGQGKCSEVRCYSDLGANFREQMSTWARSRNWVVNDAYRKNFNIARTAWWHVLM